MERIHELINELMDAIAAETKARTAKADAAKSIIAEQLLVMDESADALFEMSEIFNEAAEKLEDVTDKQLRYANTISAFVEDMSILPEGDISTFLGYCQGCGDEIHEGDSHDYDEMGNLLCGDCFDITDDEEVDENGEPKQLSFSDDAE
jgi:hypothetical protein